MNADQYRRVQEIFDQTADMPQEEHWQRVQALCSGNEEIASSVLAMLREDADSGCLLDKDAEDLLAQLADTTLRSDHIRSLIQRQIGPYRLLRVLGEGGMGIVYLAERTDIGGTVAIKLLRDAWLSPMRRERFALEQQTLVKLNHPAIARIYDASTMADGTPWFVMEFAAGLPFTEFVAAREGSLREDLLLFRAVCEAVAYAHTHAIIHRDIKPSNIVVTAAGEIKLLDFGIAKQIDAISDMPSRTTIGLRLMTPAYAAPEQSTGGAVGVFTDIYSLGVLLYETLSGQLPKSEQERDGKPLEKPSTIARSTPPTSRKVQANKREWADLDVLCQKALQPEPERRYSSVDAFIRDLTALLEGRVLEARPTSFAYAAQKFARRNHIALLATGGAIVILAAAMSVFTIRLAHARDVALAEATRTQRIQKFMFNMLGDADVEAGPSNDLKVVTLLDRELEQAGSLGSDKDTQADLYLTIGTMYNRLGKFQKSEQVLAQALELDKQVEIPAGRKRASILLQLAILQGDRGEIKEAWQSLQQVSQIVAATHLKPNDALSIQTQIATGRIHLLSGEYQEAIDVLLPISQLKPERRQVSIYDLRDGISALAEAQMYTHHYDLAEAASHRAIDLDRQLLGDSHPQTSIDVMNLGATKASAGEFTEAEQLYRQGIHTMQDWYGSHHPDVLTASSILARILISENKNDEAEAILQKILKAQKEIYGPVHERLAFTLDALGELAHRRGRTKTAELYLNQAVEMYQSLYGNKNVRTASAQSNLGAIYLLEKKQVPAEMILRQAVETYEALPYDSNYIGLTRGRLGRALLALRRYEEAEVQLTSANELMKKMQHPPLAEVKNVRADLATLYLAMHQPSTARMYQSQIANGASISAK